MKNIYIFSTKDKISTSRYFQKAAKNLFDRVYYLTNQNEFDLIKNRIKVSDIFFFIDPTTDFPLGIEKLGCLKIIYLRCEFCCVLFIGKYVSSVYSPTFDAPSPALEK